MPDRRGSRFVLEVLFLLGLAGALTLAELDPLEIAGVMLVGWVIVAALEWAAWREEPHFGSGLPPRYYIPQVSLPPAQPLEQVPAGYPEARDEAPTWIASAALREEMLGEWPMAAPTAPHREDEGEPEHDPDPWTHAGELPMAPLDELAPDPESDLHRVAVAVETKREPEPPVQVVLARSAQGIARYSLDPLAEPPPRRRFGRGGGARPGGVRVLPGRTNRQD